MSTNTDSAGAGISLRATPAAGEAARGRGGALAWARDNMVALFVLVVLLTAAFNSFIDSYRVSFFKAMSYDDYAPYMLYILGEPGGKLPASPFIYRIGSVLLAIPFYELPIVPLNGGATGERFISETIQYTRATQAVAVANTLSLFLASMLIYYYCRVRLNSTREWSLVGALLLFILAKFMGYGGVDGIALLPVTIIAITVFERMQLAFAIAVVASAFISEKIAIGATLLVAGRLLFAAENRWDYLKPTMVGAATVAAIFVTVNILQFPGLEHQRDPTMYLHSATAMLKQTFTAKGVYQVLFAPALLVGLWLVAMSAPRKGRVIEPVDVCVILGLFATGFAVDAKFTVGRLVTSCAPIFIIGAVQALSWYATKRMDASGEQDAAAHEPRHSHR